MMPKDTGHRVICSWRSAL